MSTATRGFPSPDWARFRIAAPGTFPEFRRAVTSPEGIADRLRSTAFAEIQARDAFNWAADRFEDAPEDLRAGWRRLAIAEQRHYDWLMRRMEELGVDPAAKEVSDRLWHSFQACQTAREFAHYIAGAEERGRQAGERFGQVLTTVDPVTAGIFARIAEEEVEHVAISYRYFPLPEMAPEEAP